MCFKWMEGGHIDNRVSKSTTSQRTYRPDTTCSMWIQNDPIEQSEDKQYSRPYQNGVPGSKTKSKQEQECQGESPEEKTESLWVLILSWAFRELLYLLYESVTCYFSFISHLCQLGRVHNLQRTLRKDETQRQTPLQNLRQVCLWQLLVGHYDSFLSTCLSKIWPDVGTGEWGSTIDPFYANYICAEFIGFNILMLILSIY